MYQLYTSVTNWLLAAGHLLVLRFFYLVFGFSLLASATLRAASADPHPDYAPLEALYNSTNGPGWTNSTKWLTDNNPCGWYGVSCEENRVTTINLTDNKLIGEIPNRIGDLAKLENLFLATNQLSGIIPNNIANLLLLKQLYFYENKLSGAIPSSLGNLTKLEGINLGKNALSGSIPDNIGNLTNLIALSLYENKLEGSIPSSMVNLTKLGILSLNSNNLSGEIPTGFGNLINLQILYLNNNKFSGSIPGSLGNLSKLQYLSLTSNQLTGEIPATFENLSNLVSLSLSENQLSGQIPSGVGKLIKLEMLFLGINQLTGSIPSGLGDLINLKYLELGANRLNGNIPGNFGNLTKLLRMNLSGNQIDGGIPASFGNLTQLQDLLLFDNQLSGPIPSNLGDMKSLTSLALSGNELNQSIPSSLGNLANLKGINLSNNNLTGEIPPNLGRLPKLQSFDLHDNKLSGSIPSSLGNLTNLKFLALFGNELNGTIPISLGNLTNLEILQLHRNQLTGSMPDNIGNLPNLLILYLSDNRLSGCFPTSFKAFCTNSSVAFYNNPGLPGGGNFAAFCNNEPGSNTMSAPTVALSAGVSQPILQNTPSVSLTVSGCEGGTVNWSGPNNTKGTGATIPVSTATVNTLVYSATCTVGSCVSPTGTTSVVISAAPTTGNFDGFVYGIDCETFRGWTWNRDKVNTVISVDILEGASVIATIPAGDFRQDLLTAGKGNGKHAFSFPIPANLKDGQPHLFTARVSGSSFMLKNPPKALTCQGTGGPVNQPPVAPTTVPFSAMINQAVGILLPAFTDPENGTLVYALTGLPTGLSFTASNRTITGTPTVGGEFLLTYSATDPQQAKTQVVFFLTITVPQPVNRPPTAPITTPLSATIGSAYSATLPVFTDPENQSLTYSLGSLPTGLSFTASTRLISGTAASGTAGSYVVTYSASDGTNTTQASVTLTIVPGSTTPPPTVTGDFEGYLSVVNCQEMRGWVWDRNKPNTPMMVEFFANGASIGTVEAKNYRQDLKDAQKGNGNHGYVFPTPPGIKNNGTYQITAKVQNSTYLLKGSPIAFKCAPSGRLSAESAENRLSVVVLGNPTNRDAVEVEVRGADGQPLRLQLTDANGRLVSERQVEKPAGIEHQTIPLVNQVSGLLLLRVQSGFHSVTLKILKQ